MADTEGRARAGRISGLRSGADSPAIIVATPVSPLDRRGRRLPHTLEAISERNRLLAEAAEIFMPDLSASMQAERLHRAILRYQLGGWRRHRTEDECPARLVGRIEAFCWQILRLHDHAPATRSIRRALVLR
ncbi:hypothetical protein [Bradyrhizobium sp. Ai1a-2]|uniref:hypothetical protein n=1 Tax=Bradyrhizobium sp. Ai1a-2 TaxID=196490 RepID=UPI001267E69C|nr:hypothetical protein [Bradyrhizobium sp. Ai1a-2]